MSSFLAEKQYKSTENLRMFQRTVALLCFSHSRNRNENNGMCGGFMDTTIHNYVAMFLFFVVIVLSTHLSFEPQSSSMYVFFIWPYEERCEWLFWHGIHDMSFSHSGLYNIGEHIMQLPQLWILNHMTELKKKEFFLCFMANAGLEFKAY